MEGTRVVGMSDFGWGMSDGGVGSDAAVTSELGVGVVVGAAVVFWTA